MPLCEQMDGKPRAHIVAAALILIRQQGSFIPALHDSGVKAPRHDSSVGSGD